LRLTLTFTLLEFFLRATERLFALAIAISLGLVRSIEPDRLSHVSYRDSLPS
jgi:hypothetical protein